MTHPLDRLSANPQPDDLPDYGTEPGDTCGRWLDGDEEYPKAHQCRGEIDEDRCCSGCGVMTANTRNE